MGHGAHARVLERSELRLREAADCSASAEGLARRSLSGSCRSLEQPSGGPELGNTWA